MRRILLAAFIVLAFGPRASAVIAIDQSGANQAGGVTAVTATFGQTSGTGTATSTASGAIVFVCGKRGADSASTLSITDSASQTGWTQTLAGAYVSSGTDKMGCFYRANSASLSTVTCTWSGSTTATVACVSISFTGIATTSPSDGGVSSVQTTTQNATSGNLTTTNTHDVLIFAIGDSASQNAGCSSGWTANGAYTFPTNGCAPRLAIEYDIVSATSTYSTTMTANTSSGSMLGDFEAFADTPIGGATPKMPPVVL